MWRGKRVSVVFPTYNEKDSIRETIEGFFATEYVDEVVVVDNNAAAGTREEVAATRAVLVQEPRQGTVMRSRQVDSCWLDDAAYRLGRLREGALG